MVDAAPEHGTQLHPRLQQRVGDGTLRGCGALSARDYHHVAVPTVPHRLPALCSSGKQWSKSGVIRCAAREMKD